MNSQDIQQYGSTGYGCQSGLLWSGKQGKYIFPCPCSHLRIWSRETLPAVPSRVNTLILNAQAGYVSRFPADLKSQLGLYPFCFFFFFSCFFFLRIAGVAQAIMLWHIMLLFGDAFGPAYTIFWCFGSNYALFGGGQTSKNAFNRQLRYFMVVSGVHSSVVFNACVYVCMYVWSSHIAEAEYGSTG